MPESVSFQEWQLKIHLLCLQSVGVQAFQGLLGWASWSVGYKGLGFRVL